MGNKYNILKSIVEEIRINIFKCTNINISNFKMSYFFKKKTLPSLSIF